MQLECTHYIRLIIYNSFRIWLHTVQQLYPCLDSILLVVLCYNTLHYLCQSKVETSSTNPLPHQTKTLTYSSNRYIERVCCPCTVLKSNLHYFTAQQLACTTYTWAFGCCTVHKVMKHKVFKFLSFSFKNPDNQIKDLLSTL